MSKPPRQRQTMTLKARIKRLVAALDREGGAYTELAGKTEDTRAAVQFLGRSQACALLSAFLRMAEEQRIEDSEYALEIANSVYATCTKYCDKPVILEEDAPEDETEQEKHSRWLLQGQVIKYRQAKLQLENLLGTYAQEKWKYENVD